MIVIDLALIAALLIVIAYSFYKHLKAIRARNVGHSRKIHRK